MTTATVNGTTSGEEWRPGFSDRLLALIDPRGAWMPFIYLVGIMWASVWAVQGAHWVKEMPEQTGFLLFAVFTGTVLSRLRVNQFLIHPLAIVIGLMNSTWLIINAANGESFTDKLTDFLVRASNFFTVINSNGINTDGLPFAAQIVLIGWFVAYYAAWFYFRHGNIWLAILPAGIGLVVNMNYTASKTGFNLAMFLFFALLLIMEANRSRQRIRWNEENVPEAELSYVASTGPVLVFAGSILGIAFLAPVIGQSVAVALAWEQVTGPWKGVERQFDRLFASVSSGTVAPLHSFGRSMPFKGAVNFGDQNPLAGRLGLARDIVMYVKAEESGYWKAETYHEYTSGGWLTPNRVIKGVARDSLPNAVEEYRERKAFQQTVEFEQPLDVIPARGIALYTGQPANGETTQPARFILNFTDLTKNGVLPPELQRSAQDISTRLKNSPQLPNASQIQRMLPPDVRLDRAHRQGAEIIGADVNRAEAFPPDYSSIRPATSTVRGQQYTVVSSVSKATVDQLRSATGDYPGWVKDEYLQWPNTIPERVKTLAQEWTQNAGNTMDRALAIEAKLRDYAYDTNIPAPPRDTDGVDFFLFTLKRGYADYHASAMAIMLRTIGIPSRVAAGYVAGEYDAEKERYTVREIHAHAWVEVFIPTYGWIDFNPAPNWPTPPRIYDSGSAPLEDEGLYTGDDSFGIGDITEPFPEEPVVDAAPQQVDYTPLATALAILGMVLLGFWVATRWIWSMGLRGLSAPAQTYEKMVRLASLARYGPRERETPYEYARLLGRTVPEVRGEIGQIANTYTRARYGGRDLTANERQDLHRAWAAVRRKLAGHAMLGWLRKFRR